MSTPPGVSGVTGVSGDPASMPSRGTREGGVAGRDAGQGDPSNISPGPPAEAGGITRASPTRDNTSGGGIVKPGEPLPPGPGGISVGQANPVMSHGYGLGGDTKGKSPVSPGSPMWGARMGEPRPPVGVDDQWSAMIRDTVSVAVTAAVSPVADRLSRLETDMKKPRRYRRRYEERYGLTSPSSDEEDYYREERRHNRPLARALHAELGTDVVRVIPPKIIPADDRFARSLDCETYALANRDVIYHYQIARGLGRLRKDVSSTFGRETEWDGNPPLGVFEFLNRFVKACDDNDVSEGRALYLLPEFTKGDLKRELYTLMPSHDGGKVTEVTTYLELVNWLLRKYADEQRLSDQDAEFHQAAQKDNETETQYFQRLTALRRLCGYIHTASQLKSRFIQGLWWEVRADAREYNTPAMAIEILVQYAQRKGDVCRRRRQERQGSKEPREEKRAMKRPTYTPYVTAAVDAVPPKEVNPKVGEIPPKGDKLKVGERPPPPMRYKTTRHNTTCFACNKTGHWLRECPRLDAATRGMFSQAWRERNPDKRNEISRGKPRPGVVAQVGTSQPVQEQSEADSSSSDNPYIDDGSSGHSGHNSGNE